MSLEKCLVVGRFRSVWLLQRVALRGFCVRSGW